MNKLPLLTLLLAFGSLSTEAAQPAPNLSGEWKLNPAKSFYGAFPAPQVMVRKVKHSDPSLAMSTYQKGAQGEVTSELNYTTDGKLSVNKMQGGEARGTAKWEGAKLVIESAREVQGATLKSRETWSLSADGKTLTIDGHVTLPQGEFDVKQVFDKQ
jgi:hypothetical protein